MLGGEHRLHAPLLPLDPLPELLSDPLPDPALEPPVPDPLLSGPLSVSEVEVVGGGSGSQPSSAQGSSHVVESAPPVVDVNPSVSSIWPVGDGNGSPQPSVHGSEGVLSSPHPATATSDAARSMRRR